MVNQMNAESLRLPRASIALLALTLLGYAGAARADRAEELATTVCAACHGADGNSAVPTYPRLAGLQAEYTVKQLTDYRSGRRKSDVMAPVVADLSKADIAALGAWYAGRTPQPGQAQDAALAGLGRRVWSGGDEGSNQSPCGICHEEDASGNASFPRLAGQHAAYTAQQMLDFKRGTRSNDKGRMMRSLAERMSDEDIAAVAEYLAGL